MLRLGTAVRMLFLLVIIAFSSGTEVAMLSVNRYRVKHRAQQGQRTARVLERCCRSRTTGWARIW